MVAISVITAPIKRRGVSVASIMCIAGTLHPTPNDSPTGGGICPAGPCQCICNCDVLRLASSVLERAPSLAEQSLTLFDVICALH